MIMAIDDHVFYLQQEWGIESQPKTVEQPAPGLQENGRYRYYSTQSCRHQNISEACRQQASLRSTTMTAGFL